MSILPENSFLIIKEALFSLISMVKCFFYYLKSQLFELNLIKNTGNFIKIIESHQNILLSVTFLLDTKDNDQFLFSH